jgi:hypothetical protein
VVCLKVCVQGAGGPNHYPIYRSLCLLHIDVCIYMDMLKWNKSSFLQKLVAALMRILLTFLISNVSWVLANITSESSHCFWKGNRNLGHRLCIMVCSSFWEDYYMLIFTHCWELMNSVGSHSSSSLPFVMKVMICHFVRDSHEVDCTHCRVTFNCCCGDFFATSSIFFICVVEYIIVVEKLFICSCKNNYVIIHWWM